MAKRKKKSRNSTNRAKRLRPSGSGRTQNPKKKTKRSAVTKLAAKKPHRRRQSPAAAMRSATAARTLRTLTQAPGARTPVSIGLQLSLGGDGDDRELDELTRLLQEELRGLDVSSVETVGEVAAPAEAKGFGLAAAGGLVVKLISGEAFKNIIEAAKAWTSRNAGRSVKVVLGDNSIEVSNISATQLQRLIETFERQVSGAAPGVRDG